MYLQAGIDSLARMKTVQSAVPGFAIAVAVLIAGLLLALGFVAIQAVALAGGLIGVGVVYAIGASVRSRDPILVLVLTGVVVGSLFGAGVGLVKYLADPYNQLPAMTFWLLGSLSATGVNDLFPLFGPA